jgi:hypothetical protein
MSGSGVGGMRTGELRRVVCTLTTSSSSGGAGAHWTAQRISKNLHKVVTSRMPQWFDAFENEPKTTTNTTNAAAATIAEKRTGQDHSIGCVGWNARNCYRG